MGLLPPPVRRERAGLRVRRRVRPPLPGAGWACLTPADLRARAAGLPPAPSWRQLLLRYGVPQRLRRQGDHLLLRVPVVRPADGAPEILWLAVVAGPEGVYAVGEPKASLRPLERRVRRAAGRGAAADRLLVQLLTEATDRFFPLLDRYADRLSALEEELLRPSARDASESSPAVRALLALRRDVLSARRALASLRDSVNLLQRGQGRWWGRRTLVRYAELYDHLLLAFESLDSLRDLMAATLEAHLSSVANRMNGVIKSLTVLAALVTPLTLVTGIYGMNFSIPETEWQYGYFFALGLMAALSAGMIAYFRRRGWL